MAKRAGLNAQDGHRPISKNIKQEDSRQEDTGLKAALNDVQRSLEDKHGAPPGPKSFITMQRNLGNKAVQRMIDDYKQDSTALTKTSPPASTPAKPSLQRFGLPSIFDDESSGGTPGGGQAPDQSQSQGPNETSPGEGNAPQTEPTTPQSPNDNQAPKDQEGSSVGSWAKGLMSGASSLFDSLKSTGSAASSAASSAAGPGSGSQAPGPSGPETPYDNQPATSPESTETQSTTEMAEREW